jgi:hypothetical protein
VEQPERDELLYIGCSFGEGQKPDIAAIKHDQTCINGASVRTHRFRLYVVLTLRTHTQIGFDQTLKAGQSYWIVPLTFTPECEGAFTLHAFVHDSTSKLTLTKKQ